MRKIKGLIAAVVLAIAMLMPVFAVSANALTYVSKDNVISSAYKNSEYYKKLLAVELTGDQRVDFLNVMLSQVGYMEGDSRSQLDGTFEGEKNYTEYIEWFKKNDSRWKGLSSESDWCAIFVSWAARQANISTDIISNAINAKPGSNAQGRLFDNLDFKTRQSGYVPMPGDLIFFRWDVKTSWYDHIGVVYDAVDDIVFTVEGNTTNSVGKRTYRMSEEVIIGYGVPRYTSTSLERHNWESVVMSDCDTEGTKVCKDCGKTDIMDAIGHQYWLWGQVIEEEDKELFYHVDKAPTCNSPGEKSFHCIRCDYRYKIKEIPIAEGHTPGKWVTVKEPTCLSYGRRERYCTGCGVITEAEVLEKTGHTRSDWQITSEAGCTSEGEKKAVCTVCDKLLESAIIPATGHTPSGWQTVTDASCTENGLKENRCTVCTELLESEELPANGHTGDEWTVTLEPACTMDGIREKRCTVCTEAFETEIIPETGHTEGEWSVVKEPTCIETGLRECECTVCFQIAESEVLPATGHTPGEWEVTEAAECTKDGKREKYCIDCGIAVEGEIIPKTGHSADGWTVTKEVGCTDDGKREKICTTCGRSFETEILTKTGHDIGDWEVTKAVECTKDGLKERLCRNCGDSLESEVIKCTGHDPTDLVVVKIPTCTEDGLQEKYCTKCDDTLSHRVQTKLGHTPAEWITVKQASCTEEGRRICYCSVCGDTANEEMIALLAHSYSEGRCTLCDKADPKRQTAVVLIAAGAVAVVSATALILIKLLRKNKENY